MKNSLFKDVEPEYVDELKGEFIRSVRLRTQIIKHLQSKVDNRVTTMSQRTDFEEDNWTHKNAYDLGYVKALSDLMILLE